MSKLYVGDKPVIRVTIRHPETDALTDPTNLMLQIDRPASSTQELTYSVGAGAISRESQGKYVCQTHATTEAGVHIARWIADMPGGGRATLELEFMVHQPRA